MENINTVLFKAKKYLINNSIKSANIDTEILMCSVLNKSRDHLILNMLDKIDYEKIKTFNHLWQSQLSSLYLRDIIFKNKCFLPNLNENKTNIKD